MSSHVPQTDFPSVQMLTVGQAIIQRAYSMALVKDVTALVEYAASQFAEDLPAPPPGPPSMEPLKTATAPASADEVGQMLIQASSPGLEGQFGAEAIPWAVVIPVLLDLLKSLWQK